MSARITGVNYTTEQAQLVQRVLKSSTSSADVLGVKPNASK